MTDQHGWLPHRAVVTLAELLALDTDEIVAGHLSAEVGDPEPGPNHSLAYHHGWLTRMMDLGQIEITPAHRLLTATYMDYIRRFPARSRQLPPPPEAADG